MLRTLQQWSGPIIYQMWLGEYWRCFLHFGDLKRLENFGVK